jgi:hypothetical protein
MIGRGVIWRGAGGLLLALALLASQGCSRNLLKAKNAGEAIGNYFADRAKDMLDLGDVGFSVSTTPQFCFYANGVSMFGGGFGMMEGYLVGIGGGNVGVIPYYTADAGVVVWCYEELAFGNYDKNDLAAVNTQGTGIAGLLTGPWGHPGWEPS